MSEEEMVFGSIEEYQQYIADHQARRSMAVDLASHQITGMIGELSQDHLRALRSMMSVVKDSHTPAATAGVYAGYLAAEMNHRFDICPSCGVNHQDELLTTAHDE